ncbi:MAG TPA: bifunctional glutamate N-acetyltransferase/amino-acid acetyltransferase ArgJ [Polyangiales bacterium]|nr:bifunctional glutamate N-acetyltransferase/amino-acid acetyltransferase ArgJ [Polyangiales bacterium]
MLRWHAGLRCGNVRAIMIEPKICAVPGFSFVGKNVGIVDSSLDFGCVVADRPCAAAGVFTRSSMPGAPIIVGREHIASGRLQAIVVNSKNANVATGARGIDDARAMCRGLSEACGIAPELVLPASTGVIGRRLPIEKITAAFSGLANELADDSAAAERFARAIMTTDVSPKWVSGKVGNATVLGIAKGAGMLEPNMATMLAWFMTDAEVPAELLRPMIQRVADRSFNRMSVDTDTSTSDTCVVLANGKAGPVDLAQFEQVLSEAAIYLAKKMARDGEGATKLIELHVVGAQSQDQARKTARSVINSPLVKTCIYGADPNWGRFIMAIGKVFEYEVSREKLRITFGRGESRRVLDAATVEAGNMDLDALRELLKGPEVHIELDLGSGSETYHIWGCDLTEQYIHINAHYTT